MKFLSAATALLFAAAAVAGDVEIAGMKSDRPEGLEGREPRPAPCGSPSSSSPRPTGDTEDAELVIFKFDKGGVRRGRGTTSKRQVKKFKPADGKDKVESKVEKIKVGKHRGDLPGRVRARSCPSSRRSTRTPRSPRRRTTGNSTSSSLTDNGDYYLTLLGPAKTVEKHKKDFEEFLKNFK